jgi:hypothetical protein
MAVALLIETPDQEPVDLRYHPGADREVAAPETECETGSRDREQSGDDSRDGHAEEWVDTDFLREDP